MLTDPREGELDPESHCPIHGVRYNARDNTCTDCRAEAECRPPQAIRSMDDDEQLGVALAARFARGA